MSKCILIVIDSLRSGGAEKNSVLLSKYLVECGFEITIATFRSSSLDFYTIPDGVERVSLDLVYDHSNLLQKISTNIKKIQFLRGLIRNHNVDVLISMMPVTSILCAFANIFFNRKHIIAERNYPGLQKLPYGWNLLRKVLYSRANVVAAQTEEIKKWLLRNTYSKQIHVIPNSISYPLKSTKPIVDPTQYITDEYHCLLAVGSKIHQKGFDLLIDAYSNAKKNHHKWKLIILGLERKSDPEAFDELIRSIERHEISIHVEIVGKVGNLHDWYQRCDLFVLSSRYEGFPNVLLEAMAYGCPTVSLNCKSGPADLIENGFNGILVNDMSAVGLSSELKNLIADDQLRKVIGKNATGVIDKYSDHIILKKWLEIIQ